MNNNFIKKIYTVDLCGPLKYKLYFYVFLLQKKKCLFVFLFVCLINSLIKGKTFTTYIKRIHFSFDLSSATYVTTIFSEHLVTPSVRLYTRKIKMPILKCNFCNFSTDRPAHFSSHLKTQKHEILQFLCEEEDVDHDVAQLGNGGGIDSVTVRNDDHDDDNDDAGVTHTPIPSQSYSPYSREFRDFPNSP